MVVIGGFWEGVFMFRWVFFFGFIGFLFRISGVVKGGLEWGFLNGRV